MNHPNIFNNNSNKEIAQIIYDEFVKDNSLSKNNVRKRIDIFEESFWSKHQIEEELLEPELVDRKWEISDIVMEKILQLEKELELKENDLLTTRSDEEIAEMIFNRVKKQTNLSVVNLGLYWSEIGVEDIFSFPQSTYYRWEKINIMVWQRTKMLKKRRRHEKIERERNDAFNYINEIIEWIKDKGLKKLSKINLKLYLSEKKMDLAPVNRQALYLEVNKEIESKKEKI